MSTAVQTAIANDPGAPARGVFGQPKGLYYLAATEAWEQFSYYGMTALVVLHMVNQLLLPRSWSRRSWRLATTGCHRSGRSCISRLTLFVASNIIGRLGGFYETLSPAVFWGVHAAIAAAGGVAVLVFGDAIARVLRIDKQLAQ